MELVDFILRGTPLRSPSIPHAERAADGCVFESDALRLVRRFCRGARLIQLERERAPLLRRGVPYLVTDADGWQTWAVFDGEWYAASPHSTYSTLYAAIAAAVRPCLPSRRAALRVLRRVDVTQGPAAAGRCAEIARHFFGSAGAR